jgi:hypothetical protein
MKKPQPDRILAGDESNASCETLIPSRSPIHAAFRARVNFDLGEWQKRKARATEPGSVTLIQRLARLAASNGRLSFARQLPRPPTPTKAVLGPKRANGPQTVALGVLQTESSVSVNEKPRPAWEYQRMIGSIDQGRYRR